MWVAIHGKKEEKPTFWTKFEGLYQYRSGSVLFFYFDQLSYFGHTLLISYPI